MQKPEYISKLEIGGTVFSIMNLDIFDGNLHKFLEDKKLTRVFEKSKMMLNGDLIWNEIIYKTKQPFYLHILNETITENRWELQIYYKPEQLNELIIFIRQVIKQFRDATTNNNRT